MKASAAQPGSINVRLPPLEWLSELFANPPNNALTVVKMPANIDSTALLAKLESQYGLKLANGQDNLKGKIISTPRRDELTQIPINEQLIVELYSK